MLNSYQEAYSKENDSGLEDDKPAEKWWDFLKQMEDVSSDWSDFIEPTKGIRRKIYEFASHQLFDNVIIIVIFFNLIVMGIQYEEARPVYIEVLNILNLIFSAIFVLEAVIKLWGFGPTRYFRNAWNRFDFFVVVTSLLDFAFESLGDDGSLQFLKSFQIIRVLKVLRITRLVFFFNL